MKHLSLLALLVAAPASAQTLQLDDALLADVVRLVGDPGPVFLGQGFLAQGDPPPAADDDEDSPPKRRRKSSSDDDNGGTRDGGGAGISAGGSGAFSPMGRPFGVGLQLGFPTAVTIKYFLVADQALQAGLGLFGGYVVEPGLSLHVDYVWHPTQLASASAFNLSWYIGGGGWLMLYGRNGVRPLVPLWPWYLFPTPLWFGARMPIGVNLALREVPLEFFLEAAPSLLIFPWLTFGLGFSVGARFYF